MGEQYYEQLVMVGLKTGTRLGSIETHIRSLTLKMTPILDVDILPPLIDLSSVCCLHKSKECPGKSLIFLEDCNILCTPL